MSQNDELPPALQEFRRRYAGLAPLLPYLDIAYVVLKDPLASRIGILTTGDRAIALRMAAIPHAGRTCEYEGADWRAKRVSLPAAELMDLTEMLVGDSLSLGKDRFILFGRTSWNFTTFPPSSRGSAVGGSRIAVTGAGALLQKAAPDFNDWTRRIKGHRQLIDVRDLSSKLGLSQDLTNENSQMQAIVSAEMPLVVEQILLTGADVSFTLRFDIETVATVPLLVKLRNEGTGETATRDVVVSREAIPVRWATLTPGAGAVQISIVVQMGDWVFFEHQAAGFVDHLGMRLRPSDALTSLDIPANIDPPPAQHSAQVGVFLPKAGAEFSGAVVGRRWRLEDRIGGGGYGTVYAAHHAITHYSCAVKVIPHDGRTPELEERLKRETRATNDVSHPCIVRIFDAGFDEDHLVAYSAMERLRGQPLAAVMVGRLESARIWDLMRSPLQALSMCHDAGVVHRDISPSNLYLAEDGLVRILDFGLCYLVGRPRVTRSKTSLGNVEYASPEQLASANQSDATADVWSLGVVLYEMLTGQHPFAAETDVAMILAAAGAPHRPAEEFGVAPAMSAVIDRCLQKRPQDRPANAGELLDFLSPLF